MRTTPVEYVFTYSTGVVACALLISAVAKAGRTATTLRAMRDLRVPALFHRRWMAHLLPAWEALLALFLIFGGPGPRTLASTAAVATLALFSFYLVGVLRRKEVVECGCFGPLSVSSLVTWRSVARNAFLALLALAAMVCAPADQSFIHFLARIETLGQSLIALAWALTLIVILTSQLLIARGRTSAATTPTGVASIRRAGVPPAPMSPELIAKGLDPNRPGEPALGDAIPDIELVTEHGQAVPLRELGHGNPVLLVFISMECGSCLAAVERVTAWQEALSPIQVRFATSSLPAAVAEHSAAAVPYTRYGALCARRSFGIQSNLAAVALGGQQQPVVASAVAYGLAEIESLVEQLEFIMRSA